MQAFPWSDRPGCRRGFLRVQVPHPTLICADVRDTKSDTKPRSWPLLSVSIPYLIHESIPIKCNHKPLSHCNLRQPRNRCTKFATTVTEQSHGQPW